MREMFVPVCIHKPGELSLNDKMKQRRGKEEDILKSQPRNIEQDDSRIHENG